MVGVGGMAESGRKSTDPLRLEVERRRPRVLRFAGNAQRKLIEEALLRCWTGESGVRAAEDIL